MQLVERHIIKRSHKHYLEIDNQCLLSKNLYNYANYTLRQHFFQTGEYLNYNTIQKQLQDSPDYKAIPAKVSQQILMVLDKNWKSFFKALIAYREDPNKFLGRPRLPKYKNTTTGRNLLIYTTQALSKPNLRQGIIQPSKTEIFIKTNIPSEQICQVRMIPKLDHYVFEVIYDHEPTPQKLDLNRIASIDLGLNNLATVTFNQAGIQPLLINGRPLKSMNQYFNKDKALLQSKLGSGTSKRVQKLCSKRNWKVDDYLHKASRTIITVLNGLGVGTLIIGNNPLWKQECQMGRRNNQNFVQIPYERFIWMLKYKAQLLGIQVIVREESYTSKASFLDLDVIPTYHRGGNNNYRFSGRRISRGMYRSSTGKKLNADVNGSYNIMRKAVPNVFGNGIEGIVVCPVRITPTK
ncbi:MAG: transposase [Phormidium sp.]